MEKDKIRVTVWNEYIHEKKYENITKIYPDGIHECLAAFLRKEDFEVRTATLQMPECGLTEEVLEQTDVLIWWGHCAHDQVPDEIAERVKKHVLRGMGFLPLHSSHLCKPLKLLLGTSLCLRWKNDQSEVLRCVNPGHPIAAGVEDGFLLPIEEMYGEFFDIPTPDELVFIGWFPNGEVFRSGCVWNRGHGKIFYFQPGHEAYPIYYDPNIQKVICNAVLYLCPVNRRIGDYGCYHVE